MGKLSDLIHDFSVNWEDMKNSIESHTGVLTAVGIGVSVLGTVLACKATLKVKEASDEHCKLIEDTKANCAESEMTEKETKKELSKAYRHIGLYYVKKFLPALGVSIVGYSLIVKAHNIEVAKNEALMTAYIGLEALFNKYRQTVSERYGEETEKDIMAETQQKFAENNVLEGPNTPFVNGSCILFNDSCTDYTKGNPQANEFVLRTGENELVSKYNSGKRVYINDVCRCFGHPEVKGGWKWCWYKYCTEAPNFLVDRMHQPEFIRGICFDGKTEPIAKIFLNGCVHVDRTYEADVRNTELADGGVMGGKIGMDECIIG
jgi:hypothetical protein